MMGKFRAVVIHEISIAETQLKGVDAHYLYVLHCIGMFAFVELLDNFHFVICSISHFSKAFSFH